MSKRTTIHNEPNFALSLEKEQGELFIHVVIRKATKKVLEDILWEFAKFKANAYFEGYENIYTYTKDKRLFRIFGAEDIGSFNAGGMEFRVGRWALN